MADRRRVVAKKRISSRKKGKHKRKIRRGMAVIPTLQGLADGMLMQYECLRQMGGNEVAGEVLALLLHDLEKEKSNSTLAKDIESMFEPKH